MTEQKESFSFDVLLELPEQWMLGVTSLKVYNTVYNLTEQYNKLEVVLKQEQLKSTLTLNRQKMFSIYIKSLK